VFSVFREVLQICCLTVAKRFAFMVSIREAWWRILKRLQTHAQASEFFRFGVKSLDPIRTVAHLKPDRDVRVYSCPRQEPM